MHSHVYLQLGFREGAIGTHRTKFHTPTPLQLPVFSEQMVRIRFVVGELLVTGFAVMSSLARWVLKFDVFVEFGLRSSYQMAERALWRGKENSLTHGPLGDLNGILYK